MNYFDFLTLFFMIFFIFVTFLRIKQLKNKNVDVVVLAKGEKPFLNRIIESSYSAGLVIWFSTTFIHIFHLEHYFPQFIFNQLFNFEAIKLLGVFSILTAIMFYVLGLHFLNDSWRIGVDTDNPGQLVTSGIYSLSRNPIMVCLFLFVTGICLIYSSIILILTVIITSFSIHYQVSKEEDFLLDCYGKSYEDYKKTAGRYFSISRVFSLFIH